MFVKDNFLIGSHELEEKIPIPDWIVPFKPVLDSLVKAKDILNRLGLSCASAKLNQRCLEFGPIHAKEFKKKKFVREIFLGPKQLNSEVSCSD